MKWINRLFIAILPLGLIFLSGCDTEDSSTYDIEITWSVAGAPSCTQSPTINGETRTIVFDRMYISVYEEATDPETGILPVFTTTPVSAPLCTDLIFTIPNLSRGTYFVKVNAMAQLEDDLEPLPYYQAEMEVRVPQVQENRYDFSLLLGNSNIPVAWDFANPGQCTQQNVATVTVTMARTDGLQTLTEENVPCENGQVYFMALPWSSYQLTVDGYNASSQLTQRGVYNNGLPFELKPNDNYGQHWVVLEPIN